MVYAKANSIQTVTVEAPNWIHKYIIGRKGANIKKITQDLSKVCRSILSGFFVYFKMIKLKVLKKIELLIYNLSEKIQLLIFSLIKIQLFN